MLLKTSAAVFLSAVFAPCVSAQDAVRSTATAAVDESVAVDEEIVVRGRRLSEIEVDLDLYIVDGSDLAGKSWQRTADYLAVVSLAQVDPFNQERITRVQGNEIVSRIARREMSDVD